MSEIITQLRISNNRYSVDKYFERIFARARMISMISVFASNYEVHGGAGGVTPTGKRRRGIDHGASVVYSLERDRTRLIFPNGRHAISRALTRIGPNRR